MKRRTVGLTLLLALVLTGGMGSWLWSEARISTLGEVETRVGPWMPVWTAARWGLLGLTALMILGQAYRPPPSGLVPTGPGRQALGWRLVLWLGTIELIVGQAMLARWIASLVSG